MDADSVAEKYPNSYAVMIVEERDSLGVSSGKVLYVANSLEEIDHYVQLHNGLEGHTLRYITGENLR